MKQKLELAGDIGGTKTIIAIHHQKQILREEIFPSAEYASLEDILKSFLEQGETIDRACFGIAGPIVNQNCRTTNLPWHIDASSLSALFSIPHVRLINDLEAMAIGVQHLAPEDLLELNPSALDQPGNRAVIAAGTGLGEALLIWNGTRHLAIATEGGHADLAAQNSEQDDLLKFLRNRFSGHVSLERILSGDGIGTLYDFMVETGREPPCPEVSQCIDGDRNALISRLGLEKSDAACSRALSLFVDFYGAAAGNLGLCTFATGGIYIGGGIAPKIQSALTGGAFMRAFLSKGRFRDFLSQIPVRLILNQKVPLLGALAYWSDQEA